MKNFLIATLALFPMSASAVPYDDTLTFSVSAACAELTQTQNPTQSNDEDWQNYLNCIRVLTYLDTKY